MLLFVYFDELKTSSSVNSGSSRHHVNEKPRQEINENMIGVVCRFGSRRQDAQLQTDLLLEEKKKKTTNL